MFRQQLFSTNTLVTLRNGAVVDERIIDPILKAIESLIKRSFHEYVEFIETCEKYESLDQGLPSLTTDDLSKWMPLSSKISFKDVVNVALSAVDNDMVLGSPFPREPRTMYPAKLSY